MATKKTIDERLDALKKKQDELKAQERSLKAKKSAQERKARTKRLVEIGATVESVLGKPIEKEDLVKLKIFLEDQEERGKFFSKALSSESNSTCNQEI